MTGQWITLTLLGLAASFLPWQTSADILLLRNKQGVRRAIAFVAGITAWRVLLCALLYLILVGGFEASRTAAESASAAESGVASLNLFNERSILDLLFIIGGLLLVLRAARMWNGQPALEQEEPKILTRLQSMSALTAFVLGFLWTALTISQWIFLTAGVNQIATMNTSVTGDLIAVVFFLLVASLIVAAPIVIYVARPAEAAVVLEDMNTKLSSFASKLGIVLIGAIGIYLIWQGAAALLG